MRGDTLEDLVDLINIWNDCAEDDDRGRGNDNLCLLLRDDGSGRLGCIFNSPDTFCPQFEFDTPEDLKAYLKDWLE